MPFLRRLWNDEVGFVVSSDLLILSTIVVLGVIVGLVTFRDQVVQELGDMAGAVGAVNQTYSYAAATVTYSFAPAVMGSFVVAGSSYDDLSDFCDEGDNANAPPECIEFTASSDESP
ncbi:MAG: hypothetical protein RIC55_26020 [Pirellulaceae bacterium]